MHIRVRRNNYVLEVKIGQWNSLYIISSAQVLYEQGSSKNFSPEIIKKTNAPLSFHINQAVYCLFSRWLIADDRPQYKCLGYTCTMKCIHGPRSYCYQKLTPWSRHGFMQVSNSTNHNRWTDLISISNNDHDRWTNLTSTFTVDQFSRVLNFNLSNPLILACVACPYHSSLSKWRHGWMSQIPRVITNWMSQQHSRYFL